MGNQVQTDIGHTKEDEDQLKYSYQTDNGGVVKIKQRINPYSHLKLSENVSNPNTIKDAYKNRATSQKRQERATASLAYYMITSRSRDCFKKIGNEFIITNEDIFLLTAIGYTTKIVEMITQDESVIVGQNEHGHIPLYMAARSGFYDLTSILITKNSSINQQQINGSTALHGAAFYGQTEIVKLLLEYGANPNLENKWNHTPYDEAANNEIKNVLQTFHQDKISKFQELLKNEKVDQRLRVLKYGNDWIGKEIIINEDIPDDWTMAWHGTKYQHLQSIVQHGLQPAGSTLPNGKTIATERNHYKLDQEYFDIQDWSRAIFVSPSLRYAAHQVYAERIFCKKIRYCVVLKIFFHPSLQCTKHNPTIKQFDPIRGEPPNAEYRLRNTNSPPGEADAPEYGIPNSDDDVILRIADTSRQSISDSNNFSKYLIVKSIVFIKVEFLDTVDKSKENFSHDDIKAIFS